MTRSPGRCAVGMGRLPGRLEREGRVAHEDAAARFGQGAVHDEARDDMPRPRHRAAAHLDPMLGVDPDDDPRGAIDLSIDPDLAVIVDVRLEPHPGAGERDIADAFRDLDCGSIPGEGEAHRPTLPYVATHFPAGVVMIRE